MPKIMAQYSKTESAASKGSMTLGNLEVQAVPSKETRVLEQIPVSGPPSTREPFQPAFIAPKRPHKPKDPNKWYIVYGRSGSIWFMV